MFLPVLLANELLESLDIAFKEETIVNEAPKSHIKKNRKRKLEDETADRPFSVIPYSDLKLE